MNTSPTTVAIIAGARPNFMKVAPLIQALSTDRAIRPVLIHTGQHYDHNMSGLFFQDLGIGEPSHHLEVGSGSHAVQTAEIMKRLEPVLLESKPAGLVIVGDVNSTVAGAVVAKKIGIDVVHVEAGLRSFDRSMPEEINRILTDSISDLFLVTEESGRTNLLREGIPEWRIHLVGNLMIDSLRRHRDQALKSDVHARLGIQTGEYGLVTLHRPANVDDPAQLGEIVSALSEIAQEFPLYWPMHPRTRNTVGRLPLSERIHILDPLGYIEFLAMQAGSRVVLTDSGGIQEETTVLGVPCLTLRNNTERPVTIEVGTNRLAGTSRETILSAWAEDRANPKKGQAPPLWDGKAGERCYQVLRRYFVEGIHPGGSSDQLGTLG